MTAGVLGVAEGSELAPITLLRQDNLALGVVAEDGEAAAEAVNKFWARGGGPDRGTSVRPMPPVPKTREAVAGTQSSVVVTLELPLALGVAQPLVLADILLGRGSLLFPEATVEVLAPFVPGRSVLLLVVTAVSPLEDLEAAIEKGWKAVTAPVTEEGTCASTSPRGRGQPPRAGAVRRARRVGARPWRSARHGGSRRPSWR